MVKVLLPTIPDEFKELYPKVMTKAYFTGFKYYISDYAGLYARLIRHIAH